MKDEKRLQDIIDKRLYEIELEKEIRFLEQLEDDLERKRSSKTFFSDMILNRINELKKIID